MNTQNNLHGNFMLIDQLGVCITGRPGIGKSELSLALIDRGHSLISDDCIDIRNENGMVIGSCPSVSQGFLSVFGIGIINVSQLFGESALATEHSVALVIQLIDSEKITIENSLRPITTAKKLLGVKIPEITLSIHRRKNLPLLIETLVRHFHLTKNGSDTIPNLFSLKEG